MSNQSTLGGGTVSHDKVIEEEKRVKRRGNPECDSCSEPKAHIDEPMMSGFRGYLCKNDNCPVDS